MATDSSKNPINVSRTGYGFGIYLDEEKLQSAADRVIIIK